MENAGVVNIQMRENPLEVEEGSESDDEGKKKKAKDKTKKNKQGDQLEKNNVNKDVEDAKNIAANEKPVPEEAKAKDDKKFKCTTCKDAAFETNLEFKAHFKTDWHNFNLKRKMEV